MDKILGCKDPYKGDPEKRFEFVKSFGSGGFGTVELCRDRENGNKLVIKKLAKIESTTINEIAMLYHIRHKYIIKLYDYYQTKINQDTIDRNEIKGAKVNTPMYGMVIEFGEGGDLLKYITERISIEEIILLKIIDQSAQALRFLNENRTMHRDIKPENILLDKYGDIKLADFGTGDVLQEDSAYRTFTQQTGTQIYMAPEIKAQHKYYTYAIDVYSLGVSIYRACRGNLENNDLKTIDVDGLPEPIPDTYSPEFISLIKKMLAFDENERATLTDIQSMIQSIITPIKLTEYQQNQLDNSLSLYYGTDGVTNKQEAIENFKKLVSETNNECPEPLFQLAHSFLYGDSNQQDKEEAIKLLRLASRKLYCPALKLLSFCYQHGFGVEKDMFTSVQLLTIAQKNDPEASFLLGCLTFNGEAIDIKNNKYDTKEVVKQDFELAFHYFLNAKNFVPAQNYIGLCYNNGRGIEANPFEAYKYFSSAAESHFLDAVYNLAVFYLTEKPNDQIYIEKAVNLLNEAASEYHIGACLKLSELYSEGALVQKDEKKANFYSKIDDKNSVNFDTIYSYALFKLKGDNYAQYEAFTILSLCSEKHAGAAYRLAQCYRDGIGTKKDDQKAANLFEQASNHGIFDATVDLALCFLNGTGREMDKEKGIAMMKDSIEQGSIYAARCLAQCYITKNGVEEEGDEKAIDLLRTAQSCGDLESTYLLAKSIRKKGLEEMDFDLLEEAMSLFEKAAMKGHPGASHEFAMIYSQGFEIYIDKEKAFEFFQIASQKNHPQATTELGKLYEKQHENEKAFKSYQKASNLGDNDGLYHLGMCYLKGIGVDIDKGKGRSLIEKAAEAGIVDAKYQLGFLYQEGIGGQKDEGKSAALFEEASNLGSIQAKVQLGNCYLHGIGVQQDNSKAFRMFKQASDNKSVEGKYKLAKLYLKGLGVRKNPNEAILLFEFLVREKNYVPAMYRLAKCYIDGVGCDADPKKGVQTLKKAVKKGNAKAMNLLGLCYINGNGAKLNTDAAREYFKKAADAGNKDALENLNKYRKEENVPPKTLENFDDENQFEKPSNNLPFYNVGSAAYFHSNFNESARPPLEPSSSQRLPDNGRVIRPPLKDARSPRVNPRLGSAPRKQRDRNQTNDRIDTGRKPPRQVAFGQITPLYQMNRGASRRAINQPVPQVQHRR